MKPPFCAMCGNNLRNDEREFELLYFKLTLEEEASNQRMRDNRRVGHPAGAYWFCADHTEQAKTLTHLHIKEAKAIMEQPPKPPSLWERFRALFGKTK